MSDIPGVALTHIPATAKDLSNWPGAKVFAV
jgi:hypothetical protein